MTVQRHILYQSTNSFCELIKANEPGPYIAFIYMNCNQIYNICCKSATKWKPYRFPLSYKASGHIKLEARHITGRGHSLTHKMDISSPKKQIRGIIRVACAVGCPFVQDYEADGQSARVGVPAPRRSAGPTSTHNQNLYE